MPSASTPPPTRLPGWLFAVILSLLPILYAFLGFSLDYGFLSLPRFGEVFRSQALEPVQRYAPPVKTGDVGYDGQFYAQIALDPALRHPSLPAACDNLSYRARRIGLPLMAFVLGGGQSWAVLQIYAILNLGFWFLLMALLVREFGLESSVARWLLIGILWNAGSLISINRALTDLPALCLGVAAIRFLGKARDEHALSLEPLERSWISASLCSAGSVLIKETSLLSLLIYGEGSWRRSAWRWGTISVIVLLPLVLWDIYIRCMVGSDATGLGNFAPPFFGFLHKWITTWREAIANFPRLPLLELIAPWTIFVQCLYLFRYPLWQSRWWRFGIGSAILAIMIGPWVWSTQSAYARCLLPLAASFNVVLAQSVHSQSLRRRWWLLGNLGLMDRAAPGLLILWLVHTAWIGMLSANRHRASESVEP